jgi:hypothetical protein
VVKFFPYKEETASALFEQENGFWLTVHSAELGKKNLNKICLPVYVLNFSTKEDCNECDLPM